MVDGDDAAGGAWVEVVEVGAEVVPGDGTVDPVGRFGAPAPGLEVDGLDADVDESAEGADVAESSAKSGSTTTVASSGPTGTATMDVGTARAG